LTIYDVVRTRGRCKEVGRLYGYEYNRNGRLTLLHDRRKNRRTLFSYDDADRMLDADEKAFTTPAEDEEDVVRRGKDTRLGYDFDGNVISRRTDGRIQANGTYAGGKLTTFDFDQLLGRELAIRAARRHGRNLRWADSRRCM
jgi:YD repeat-containing protein